MGEHDLRIATNLRTLLIVESLAVAGRALSATEINHHLGLPKQSIHRLCKTLAAKGFLIRDTNTRKFSPSTRLRAMVSGLFNMPHLEIATHQILESVAKQVGETVNLVVPEVHGMRYLDRVETHWPFRIQLPIGTHVPFHCTAGGKTYLSSLPLSRRRALIRTLNLSAETDNTITDAEQLVDEAATIAGHGYAIDDEEFMENMVAIAVPVRDLNRHFFAALAVHGPVQRMNLTHALAQLQVLEDGAKRLQALLFDAAI